MVVAVYCTIKVLQSLQCSIVETLPFLTSYLLDFLAPLCLFAVSNSVFLLYGFKVVRLIPIMVICLVASIVWELVAPALLSWSVSDVGDVVSYFLGGLFYWLIFGEPENAVRVR